MRALKRALFAGVLGGLLAFSAAWACDIQPNRVWLPEVDSAGMRNCVGEAFLEFSPTSTPMTYSLHHRLDFNCLGAKTTDGKPVSITVTNCGSSTDDPTHKAKQSSSCVPSGGGHRADGRLPGPFVFDLPVSHTFHTTLTITSPPAAYWVGSISGWCYPAGKVATCNWTDNTSFGFDRVHTIE